MIVAVFSLIAGMAMAALGWLVWRIAYAGMTHRQMDPEMFD